jgi:alpha-tubulin suppressor-like RCC1 family protein
VVAGPALVNYQWFEGVSGDTTRPVVGATQARFVTPVLTEATAYWVRVGNGWSVRNSATIPVEFSGRPNLIEQSPGARAVTGQSVTLAVRALGENLSFAWYEGEAGDLSRPVPGAAASSFTPPSVASDTAYWVRISNAHGHTDSRTIPLEVNRPVIASAGVTHSLFLKADGTVWATGNNIYGQLTGVPSSARTTPVQIMTDVYAISAGDAYSLFLRTDGTAWACGYNADGQLGDGTTTHRTVPVQVLSNVRAIAAGPTHSLFLKNDGTAWASGSNANGELGDGTTTRRLTPVFALDRVVAIATGGVRGISVPGLPLNGGGHSLFIRDDARAWACGANTFGQLGDGTTTARVLPVPVLAGVKAIAAAYTVDLSLSVASAHSLFLKIDGTAWGSGRNLNGQLGRSGSGNQLSPIPILDEVEALHVGSHHSFFIRRGGDVWACGADHNGQLGLGATSTRRELGLVRTHVASLATGMSHTFFLSSDGSLFAAGSNDSGRLGDGTAIRRLAPTRLDPVIVTPPARQAGAVFSELVASPAETLSYQWFLGASGDVSRPLADTTGPRAWLRADVAPTPYWVRVSNWLGHVDSATIVALPDYDLWAHRFTFVGSDPAPEADADGDGLANLLEYALGTDPLAAQVTGLPASEVGSIEGEARLGLTFTRIADPSLIYEVMASGDLTTWNTIWGSMGDENVAGPVTVHDPVALASGARRFLILRVTR